MLVWLAGAGLLLSSTHGFDYLVSWCGLSTLAPELLQALAAAKASCFHVCRPPWCKLVQLAGPDCFLPEALSTWRHSCLACCLPTSVASTRASRSVWSLLLRPGGDVLSAVSRLVGCPCPRTEALVLARRPCTGSHSFFDRLVSSL